MDLPYIIRVKLPSRTGWWRLWVWLLIGLLVVGVVRLALLRQPAATPPGPSAALALASRPPGATIRIDGKARGQTPATQALSPGLHHVTLRDTGRADVTYTVHLAPNVIINLTGILWLRTPVVRPVRSPLPGATIAGTVFLADGRLALALALPAGDERQVWIVGQDGATQRVGPPFARGAAAVSPDGTQVAYLAQPSASAAPGAPASDGAGGRLTEVWVTDRNGDSGQRRYVLPPNTAAERLVDLAWAPDSTQLLLVSEQHPQGSGVRQRLQWLNLATAPPATRELLTLPGQVVPGSYLWNTAGDRLALLVRADNRTTLGLLGRDGQYFRSLADVPVAGVPPAFSPLAWLPKEGGVVYAAAAPGRQAAVWPTFASPAPDLLVDDLTAGGSRRLPGTGGWGPGWRDDGFALALTRPKRNGPLTVQAFDLTTDTAAQTLGTLALPADRVAGVRWDMPHGQALVAIASATGGPPDLWLVTWTTHGEEGGR
jgi:hypothetical protein